MHNYLLETERLILRLPQMSDADAIQRLVSNYDIAKMTLNIPHPYPENAAKEWLERISASDDNANYSFVITLKSDKQVIGNIGIGCHPRQKRAEIGYWLGKDYWNQGYMTEAAQRVVQFGFEELGLARIQAGYFPENNASLRVMKKIGMQFEGTWRHYVQKNGENRDISMCAILREDWE